MPSPGRTKRIAPLSDYKNADIPGLLSSLSHAPLLEAVTESDVSTVWLNWSQMVNEFTDQHKPTGSVTIRAQSKPWMTSELHKLSQKKHRLFRAAKNRHSKSTWNDNKIVRNIFNAHLQKAKRRHYHHLNNSLRSTHCNAAW